ncbi:MAG: hypothetical protein ACIAQF_11405 [Phycisphaerales bacterium JB065]
MLAELADQPALLVPLQVLLLTVPGIVLATVFRAIGLPGGRGSAAIGAGILAGILCGSLVLGSVAPEVYNPMLRGSLQEQDALLEVEQDIAAEKTAALAALRATGVSEIAEDEILVEIDRKYEPRLTAAQETLADSQRRHTNRLSVILAILAGLVFASGYFRRTRTEIADLPAGSRPRVGESAVPKVLGPFPPPPVELLMLVMAAAPTAIFARWLLGVDVPIAIALGLVLAVPGATVRRRTQALSGGWAFLIAALLISVCSIMAYGQGSASTALIGTALLASVLLLAIDNSLLKTRRAEKRFHDVLFYAILLPALAGAIATVVDLQALISTGPFWIALAIGLIASGDGRWIGYWLAIRFFAEPPASARPSSTANSVISAGSATMQLVLAVLAFRAVPEAGALLFGVLCGSGLLELSRTLRARIARTADDMLAPGHDPTN